MPPEWTKRVPARSVTTCGVPKVPLPVLSMIDNVLPRSQYRSWATALSKGPSRLKSPVADARASPPSGTSADSWAIQGASEWRAGPAAGLGLQQRRAGQHGR